MSEPLALSLARKLRRLKGVRLKACHEAADELVLLERTVRLQRERINNLEASFAPLRDRNQELLRALKLVEYALAEPGNTVTHRAAMHALKGLGLIKLETVPRREQGQV